MNTTANTPDQSTVGSGKLPRDLFDEDTGMVKMPTYITDYLTDFDTLQAFRDILREWFTCSFREGYARSDHLDATLFNGLDTFFADFQKPALQIEILKNIKPDIQP